MVYKVLGALIIGAATAMALIILKDDLGLDGQPFSKSETCRQLTPAQLLAKMIDDDFQELQKSKQLPVEWSSIATVELRMNSQLAKTLLGKERPSFHRIKDGKSYLELEFMDLPDEDNPGIIIQASLFDIKSKNKIFEIGRTYTMNDLNKVQPESNTAPSKKGK